MFSITRTFHFHKLHIASCVCLCYLHERPLVSSVTIRLRSTGRFLDLLCPHSLDLQPVTQPLQTPSVTGVKSGYWGEKGFSADLHPLIPCKNPFTKEWQRKVRCIPSPNLAIDKIFALLIILK